MIWNFLIITSACALTYWAGRFVGRREHRWAATTPEEAWDNGLQHGLRLAHTAVTTYPKPWINFGEERGWDLARHQLTEVLASYLEETHPNETNPTATQAAKRGVS